LEISLWFEMFGRPFFVVRWMDGWMTGWMDAAADAAATDDL